MFGRALRPLQPKGWTSVTAAHRRPAPLRTRMTSARKMPERQSSQPWLLLLQLQQHQSSWEPRRPSLLLRPQRRRLQQPPQHCSAMGQERWGAWGLQSYLRPKVLQRLLPFSAPAFWGCQRTHRQYHQLNPWPTPQSRRVPRHLPHQPPLPKWFLVTAHPANLRRSHAPRATTPSLWMVGRPCWSALESMPTTPWSTPGASRRRARLGGGPHPARGASSCWVWIARWSTRRMTPMLWHGRRW
mmetsp:Transcript_79660/g.200414  ORF Transcript_79660/g.200414 Transcript_79660/m.200414 type:complete len:242 (+) Transcript_79660:394-1119(+)